MSFVSLIFVVVGGLTACLGHRKNRAESGDVYQMNSKPGLLGRFF
jgi:hypothetical protein